MTDRESWMKLIRDEFDPPPRYTVHGWDDGAGRIADAILADITLAVRRERERCAHIARNGCLVPPDGGSPTEGDSRNLEAAGAALLKLVEFNIPPDVQELLILGNEKLGVRPGALTAALSAALGIYNRFDK